MLPLKTAPIPRSLVFSFWVVGTPSRPFSFGMVDCKLTMRILFGLALLAALICYIMEFVNYNPKTPGMIGLFAALIIVILIGYVGLGLESKVATILYIVGLLILVVLDDKYVGWQPAMICGSIAVSIGAIYAVLLLLK